MEGKSTEAEQLRILGMGGQNKHLWESALLLGPTYEDGSSSAQLPKTHLITYIFLIDILIHKIYLSKSVNTKAKHP